MNIETTKPNPSPELESLIKGFVETVRKQVLPDNDISERATPRWEYRMCRKYRHDKMSNECLTCTYNAPRYCQGPYLYLYWKENGKLKKKYIGKDPETILNKKLEQCYSHFARLGNR